MSAPQNSQSPPASPFEPFHHSTCAMPQRPARQTRASREENGSRPPIPRLTSQLVLVTCPYKHGAQGRIRTSVARKERQIYSLLPLTTRPPVQNPPHCNARHMRPRQPFAKQNLRHALALSRLTQTMLPVIWDCPGVITCGCRDAPNALSSSTG
jgi:hypothetical protein